MNHFEDEIRGEFTIELYNNPLTPDNPNDLVGYVFSQGTVNLTELCKSAAGRGGADISAAAMQHATELVLKESVFQLCNGFSINLDGIISAHVGITTQYSNVNALLKAPRTFKFEKSLSVGPVSGGGTETPDITNQPALDFE
ncbi:hypothetical protein FACS1894181_13530 [Bacteroidia bacterium]|nr:hypothetical protein FACS1894181_13530 [Bacteroidia bacterium]